jgi:hypothetical protein
MNKQDALKKLDQLEAEAKALREIIEAPAVPTRWRPEGDEFFWAINSFGESTQVCMSPTREAFGNCFRTREHAETASKAVSRTLKVVACAFEVDPAAGEFTGNRCWTAVRFKDGWDTIYRRSCCSEPAYVHTEGQAEQLADMLNVEGV